MSTPSTNPVAPLARLDSVTAGYPGRELWRGLDLRIAPGEFVAVLGGNGAGKTTLLRMLLGQLPPVAGHVEVLGAAPRRGNRRIGYVPQQRAFAPDLTLRGIDLVRLGLTGHRWGLRPASAVARRLVAEAIDRVDAAVFATAPVGTLSGGEQQRLRVAQALVDAPALLLADEPLLSLDQASQRTITGLFDTHRREHHAAVVMVTHEINPVLGYVDKVVYLTGTDWAVGPPAQVLTSPTLSRLYHSPVEVLQVRGQLVIVGTNDEAHHLPPADDPGVSGPISGQTSGRTSGAR